MSYDQQGHHHRTADGAESMAHRAKYVIIAKSTAA